MENNLDIMSVINTIINFYNNRIFGVIAIIFITYTIFTGYNLYIQKSFDSKRSWHHFIWIIKKRFIKAFMLIIALLIILIIVNDSFSFDLFKFSYFNKYWKISISLITLINIYFGKMEYFHLQFIYFLFNIKKEKNSYKSVKEYLLNLADSYTNRYLIKEKKLDILKSLAPVSLIPLLVGYILEGNSVVINWNWYTVILINIMILYFVYICKCYIEMKFDSVILLNIKFELRDIESQNDFSN